MGADAEVLAQIREAMTDPNVSIKLPMTFSHGVAAQVYIKTRKIGPLIIPSETQTLGDILKMLGDMADGSAS